MDMVIANWRISVHRARRTQGWFAAPRAAHRSRVERIANRTKCMREYQRRREQVQDWFVLRGGL